MGNSARPLNPGQACNLTILITPDRVFHPLSHAPDPFGSVASAADRRRISGGSAADLNRELRGVAMHVGQVVYPVAQPRLLERGVGIQQPQLEGELV